MTTAPPGRLILTGSVDAELDTTSWPSTGRIVRVELHGMIVSERLGVARLTPSFLSAVQLDGPEAFRTPADVSDLLGYLAWPFGVDSRTCAEPGGPGSAGVVRVVPRAQRRASHRRAGELRDPGRLARFLEVLALNSPEHAATPRC